ncbi:MAG: hypothetical protein QME90_19380 [Thermodesulfobacteriota bacterium]|nr:hypothetical protein [Thermodesulfobacteriota bacterium]
MARIQISNAPSGRIIVSFPYDPVLVQKVKTIDGRKLNHAEKYWRFPHTDGTLSPPIFWGAEPISDIFKSFWGTPIAKRLKFILT